MYLLLPSSLDGVLNPGTRMESFILIFIEKRLAEYLFLSLQKWEKGRLAISSKR